MLKKIGEWTHLTLLAMSPFLLVMFVFGFEPQLNLCASATKGQLPNFTYSQYLHRAVKAGGDTAFVRVLTTIAYPGAKAGRYVRNVIVD